MDHSRQVLLSLTVLFCTCLAVALPVGTWPIDNNEDSGAENSQAHDARSSSTSAKNMKALKQGFLGFNKRYGYYDYGLGGGRFGKRYYGDYGIGGGRFGRDVDHVDIGDASDAAQ